MVRAANGTLIAPFLLVLIYRLAFQRFPGAGRGRVTHDDCVALFRFIRGGPRSSKRVRRRDTMNLSRVWVTLHVYVPDYSRSLCYFSLFLSTPLAHSIPLSYRLSSPTCLSFLFPPRVLLRETA